MKTWVISSLLLHLDVHQHLLPAKEVVLAAVAPPVLHAVPTWFLVVQYRVAKLQPAFPFRHRVVSDMEHPTSAL